MSTRDHSHEQRDSTSRPTGIIQARIPHLIHWCGFAGAWPLVIGPLQQAASELDDETRELDEIPSKLRALPRTDPPSAWWWLLPPVPTSSGSAGATGTAKWPRRH